MRFLPDDDLTVAVVGFGYVGSCLAATLADRGVDVVGVDTNAALVAELTAGRCRLREDGLAELIASGLDSGRLRITTDYAAISAADVVLVTVGTPVLEDGSLADGQLRAACTELSGHIRPGQLFVFKSTVPPGTTRTIVQPILERAGMTGSVDFGLAFSPERLSEGVALRELNTFPIVVGGLDPDSVAATAEFWRRTLGVRAIPLGSLEAAEIVKLADNWWIDLNIALANELAKFCAGHDVDVLEVIEAANTIPKGSSTINILLPSVGVGGSCLTKDPWMVWRSAQQRGLDIQTVPTGREINAGMPDYTAQLALSTLAELGKDPASTTIAVLGLAFKNNTGDLRATPTQGAVAAFTKAGARVRIFDPLVDPAEAEEMFGLSLSPSLEEATRDADCLAVFALHKEFEGIDFAALPVGADCLVLDGRAYYSKEKIAVLRELGYVYRGIGRQA
ncbi:nucleotide sugar dehydrogenase [Micromonospora sp. PLK6-60]|uniref:nucleotide sugar dehydrogenase n=1 Tax=Micromonospora sp. PLK6-60 TaxID=2873383 RepID=UPI001CA78680|nr:nucleotide sugar dehydrogenase [Micromonospora sp. PLK6-60]MBY8870726.1 nucleotide sugar dehydrogenase [Micromonospora sp. PLK6-60]